MDLASLRVLATTGLLDKGLKLEDVSSWCRDWCIASGDSRYCVLSDVLGDVDRWWKEHDERGGVPQGLLREIDKLVRPALLDVLRLDDPAVAAQLASELRMEVAALLIPPNEWVARGYATHVPQGVVGLPPESPRSG